MFSATFPKEISRLAEDFQTDPVRVDVAPAATPVEAVRQGVYTVDPKGKMDLLTRLLGEREVGPALVFIRTKHRTDRVARALDKAGFKAQAIHGGRSQGQRQRALDGFRSGRCRVLVATDVAARGLDIQGITHVVNYDIPNSSDDYIHRIGRTARASADGDAITFVSPEDHEALAGIERTLGRSLPREDWEGAVPVRSGHAPRGKNAGGSGQRAGHGRGKGGAPKGGQRSSGQDRPKQRSNREGSAPRQKSQGRSRRRNRGQVTAAR
jgi:ATP-dependent RNA helicase RhlE